MVIFLISTINFSNFFVTALTFLKKKKPPGYKINTPNCKFSAGTRVKEKVGGLRMRRGR